MFTGATTHQLFPSNDIYLTADDIEQHLVLGDNIHTAPTALICLENTLSGTVMPQDEVVRIGELAQKHNIPLHLDGARIWNAAAKVIADQGLDATDEETRRRVYVSLRLYFHSHIADKQHDRPPRPVRLCLALSLQGYRRTCRLNGGRHQSIHQARQVVPQDVWIRRASNRHVHRRG